MDFDCPQYVNFRELKDEEASSCSIEDYIESESMLVDDQNENSHSQDKISHVDESSHSTLCESYLPNTSYQGNVGEANYLAEDFPVNRPKNLSLPEKEGKYVKINKTIAKHLNDSKKRKREDEWDGYVPLAEQVAAFHKKTPKRFHTTGPKAYEPVKHWSPHLVRPQSPNLQAVKRRRAVNVLSREEQEAKEAEEMKRYRFRAQPVKYDELNTVQLQKVKKKLLTKPKSMHLRTAQRANEMHAKKKEDEKPYEFHARPVPRAILNGPVGVKEKSQIRATEPKTPKFALKSRAEKWKNEKLNETVPESHKFKAIPVPVATSPFVVKHEVKCTEMQPFSFDTKDKERMAKKLQKIHKEIEKENRVYEFKAQPVPCPVPSELPAVPKKPPTHPEPFHLSTDNRSFKRSSLNLSQEHHSFKAQPATVLEKPPFVPVKALKLPLEIMEFQLHTDIRAEQHQKLKEKKAIEEQERELLLQQMQQLKEEEEQREIMKIRKEAVHKANPIRQYKPVEIQPSNRALTQPVSPKFRTNERLHLRHQK